MQLAGFLFPQYFDNNGNPLSGGKIYAYAAGTLTPQDTYNSASGVSANPNPIILSSSGRTKIFLQNLPYDFQIKNSAGVLIDSIEGVGSSANGGYVTVNSMFALTNLAAGAYSYVEVGGWETPGDGGGGLFYWDSTATTAQNYGTVFSPSSLPVSGRWIRIYSGPVNARWFNAKGDGTTDDTTAISRAAAYVQGLANGGTLYFPASSAGYLLTSNPSFGSKTNVEMADGAYFTNSAMAIAFGAGFKKGTDRAFSATVGTVSFADGSIPYALPQWWGAVADNVADASGAIQKALNYSTVVFLPKGTYRMSAGVDLNSNNILRGAGKHATTLKVAAGVLVDEIIGIDAKTDWKVCGIGFDNIANYPNDQTTVPYSGTFVGGGVVFPTTVNSAVVATNGCQRAEVSDCYFYGLSGWSIRFRETATPHQDIRVCDNDFLYGSYAGKPIGIYGGQIDADTTKRVLVSGNVSRINSLQKIVLPGIIGADPGSTDGIHLDRCEEFVITKNIIDYSASIGIRVEQSKYGTIAENVVTESGSDGIFVYNSCDYVKIIGNTVKSWGRLPGLYALRKYLGVYYISRETSNLALGNLPADPSITPWFAVNPYYDQGADLTYVPTYNSGNYENSTPVFTDLAGGGDIGIAANFNVASTFGIQPFRGSAGIAVVQFSTNCVVKGNTLTGNITQTGGKYNYASDFGISAVHPTNRQITSAKGFIEEGNHITGYIQAGVYVPEYCDPIQFRGPVSGNVKNPGNYSLDANSVITMLSYDMDPALLNNILLSENLPYVSISDTSYVDGGLRIAGPSRPLLTTAPFGILLHLKFKGLLNSTVRYLLDTAIGTAAAGATLNIRANRLQFTVGDGATTQTVTYSTIATWGAAPYDDVLIYVARDATGLRMNIFLPKVTSSIPEVTGGAAAATYNVDTTNGVGIGVQFNGSSNNVPMDLYRCIIWGEAFTRAQIIDRITNKRTVRNGDTVKFNLDPRSRGQFFLDKSGNCDVVYGTPTGAVSSDPDSTAFASWISSTNGSVWVTADQKCLPDDFIITSIEIETTGTPTVKVGSTAGAEDILPSTTLAAGKFTIPVNQASPTGKLSLTSSSTATIKWSFHGFRAKSFTLQASKRLYKTQTFSNVAVTVAPGVEILGQTGTMSAARVVTLPAASAYSRGDRLLVIDESGTTTGANTLVLTRAGADTINGLTTKTIGAAGGYNNCLLVSDGVSKWTVISSV